SSPVPVVHPLPLPSPESPLPDPPGSPQTLSPPLLLHLLLLLVLLQLVSECWWNGQPFPGGFAEVSNQTSWCCGGKLLWLAAAAARRNGQRADNEVVGDLGLEASVDMSVDDVCSPAASVGRSWRHCSVGIEPSCD
ncbi:uncharacterized protein LY89DRAFT_760311, partial [Mollisia scopiformis]